MGITMKTNRLNIIQIGTLTLVILVAAVAQADNWPHWRGPNYNGSTEASNLPVDLEKSMLWSAAMPGMSSATPITWGKKVFLVSSEFVESDAGPKQLYHALCLDLDSGKVLWQEKLAEATSLPPRSTYATCSPATNGKVVAFLFGTSDLFGFDLDGKKLWSVNLNDTAGIVDTKYGYSSSPLIIEDKVYACVLRYKKLSDTHQDPGNDDDCYLVCLDLNSGEIQWKVKRSSDAVYESLDAYTSPLAFNNGDGVEILIAGADYVTGHSPETGKELWRHGFNPEPADKWRLVPTPTISDGVVYANKPRRAGVFAFLPKQNTQTPYSKSTWTYDDSGSDAASPLFYKDRLYIANGRMKTLTCLDPKDGKKIWEGALGGGRVYFSSPTAADGKIYCLSQDGEVVVVAAADEFKILSRFEVGGKPCDASIAIADGKLLVRTSEKVICFGTK